MSKTSKASKPVPTSEGRDVSNDLDSEGDGDGYSGTFRWKKTKVDELKRELSIVYRIIAKVFT